MTETSTAFYVDPSSDAFPAPNLVSDLIKNTSEQKSLLEQQMTVALAWLLHHSTTFARRLGRILVEPEVAAVVDSARVTGARALASLRPNGGVSAGHLFPDIAIAGSDRSFEIILEVKIDADLHWYETPSGRLWQPDAYIRSWQDNYDPAGEARLRRVGTLTLHGTGDWQPGPSALRGADVRWADVHGLLVEMIEAGEVDSTAWAVAPDLTQAIARLVLGKPTTPEIEDPVLRWASPLVHELVERLLLLLPRSTKGAKAGVKGKAVPPYLSGYVWFGQEPRHALGVTVTRASHPYNAPTAPDTLWLTVGANGASPSSNLALRLETGGFRKTKLVQAQYSDWRTGITLDELRASPDPMRTLGAWAAAAVDAAGLTDS